MKQLGKVGLVIVLLFTARTGVTFQKGTGDVIEQQIIDMLRQLDSLDERSRAKLLSQVDEQRNELFGVLLMQLHRNPSKYTQAAVIFLMGRNRLSEAVGELTKRIDFDAGRQPETAAESLWQRYPAVDALTTIGNSSLPPILELLETDSVELRRELAIRVLRRIEGADVAHYILETRLERTLDVQKRRQLQDALSRLQKQMSGNK
ncbi:MAG TPA: HEAT repeat domain-containing protein [Candidatus Angelobacter sp.]|jgi:HEAT repeat protein|nr:HEAT repeat domain-containing protein [Candidatus Angelobacter sp.]